MINLPPESIIWIGVALQLIALFAALFNTATAKRMWLVEATTITGLTGALILITSTF